jgi:hypothetical protein
MFEQNEFHTCGNLQEAPKSRREFLQRASMGMAGLALATLLDDGVITPAQAQNAARQAAREAAGASKTTPPGPPVNANGPLAPKTPPLAAKAKHVIHIFAGGAPSHIDTFSPTPGLEKFRDQTVGGGVGFPSPFEFKRCGKNGLEISEAFPQLSGVADEMCVIRSMTADVPAHGPAAKFINTGSLVLTKPSLGSWVLYGLGTENQSLPGFVSLGGSPDWRQSAFLPSVYQGAKTEYRPGQKLDRILPNLTSEFSSIDEQRVQLDLARRLDEMHMNRVRRDEQLEARIDSFELAFRMQVEATEAFDITKEPQKIRDMYGKSQTGARLLVARRLVERGVRFVQIDAGGWDHHNDLFRGLGRTAAGIDGPAAALIKDLKELGLLEETLIIWGGEFGRTPGTNGRVGDGSGRDHHSRAFCTWMAGGGVKGGYAYGKTDDIGMDVAENPVTVHDLHATILRILGFDHTKLTYRYNGRDFRLTDNYGKIISDVIV